MAIRDVARRLFMFLVPLAGAILTLFHPKSPLATLFEDAAVRQRWLTVHVLQLFLFALLAVVVYLLLEGRHDGVANLARAAIFGFAVIYGAYDGLAGIATGVLATNAVGTPAGELSAVLSATQGLFRTMEEGGFAWIGMLGTFFWVLGLFAAGISLARPRRLPLVLGLLLLTALAGGFGYAIWRPLHLLSAGLAGLTLLVGVWGARGPWLPLAFLGISAMVLTSGHPAPFGTISFGFLFLGVLSWELLTRRVTAGQEHRVTPRVA